MTGRPLRARRLGIDSLQEAVVYMREDCEVCGSEGFAVQARVRVARDGRAIVATLNTVRGDLLAPGDAGLSEVAWAVGRTPVLVDDIISTGRAMVAAVTQLRTQGSAPPVSGSTP